MSDTVANQTGAAEDEFRRRLDDGPRRLTWTTVPVQVGDAAPELELMTSEGTSMRLGDLWRDGPAILMFWRHFGCGCGVDRAARLSEERGEYAEIGATVAILGQGEPERSAAYAAEHGITETILCDPEFNAYEAYGVLEGTLAQIVFDAPEDFLRREESAWQALIEDRREGGRPLVDNPWQLPAEFVIDTHGIVRLAYRYQYCEDFPDPRVLVAAVKEAHWAA